MLAGIPISFFGLSNRLDGVAQGNAGREIERECYHRELSLVIDGERRVRQTQNV